MPSFWSKIQKINEEYDSKLDHNILSEFNLDKINTTFFDYAFKILSTPAPEYVVSATATIREQLKEIFFDNAYLGFFLSNIKKGKKEFTNIQKIQGLENKIRINNEVKNLLYGPQERESGSGTISTKSNEPFNGDKKNIGGNRGSEILLREWEDALLYLLTQSDPSLERTVSTAHRIGKSISLVKVGKDEDSKNVYKNKFVEDELYEKFQGIRINAESQLVENEKFSKLPYSLVEIEDDKELELKEADFYAYLHHIGVGEQTMGGYVAKILYYSDLGLLGEKIVTIHHDSRISNYEKAIFFTVSSWFAKNEDELAQSLILKYNYYLNVYDDIVDVINNILLNSEYLYQFYPMEGFLNLTRDVFIASFSQRVIEEILKHSYAFEQKTISLFASDSVKKYIGQQFEVAEARGDVVLLFDEIEKLLYCERGICERYEKQLHSKKQTEAQRLFLHKLTLHELITRDETFSLVDPLGDGDLTLEELCQMSPKDIQYVLQNEIEHGYITYQDHLLSLLYIFGSLKLEDFIDRSDEISKTIVSSNETLNELFENIFDNSVVNIEPICREYFEIGVIKVLYSIRHKARNILRNIVFNGSKNEINDNIRYIEVLDIIARLPGEGYSKNSKEYYMGLLNHLDDFLIFIAKKNNLGDDFDDWDDIDDIIDPDGGPDEPPINFF